MTPRPYDYTRMIESVVKNVKDNPTKPPTITWGIKFKGCEDVYEFTAKDFDNYRKLRQKIMEATVVVCPAFPARLSTLWDLVVEEILKMAQQKKLKAVK